MSIQLPDVRKRPMQAEIDLLLSEATLMVARLESAKAGLVLQASRQRLGVVVSGGPVQSEAERFLRATLANGPRSVKDVEAEAKAAGLSLRTLRRAKNAIGVRPYKLGFKGGWVWSIPSGDAHGSFLGVKTAVTPPGRVTKGD